MWKRSDGFPARLLVTALVLVGVMAIGIAAANTGKSDPKPTTTASDPAAGFVGNETCATCHESESKSMEHSLHGKAVDSRTPSAKPGGSCESCHGPGQKHVESGSKADIRRFNAISAREANETCLSCHNKNAHEQWQGSMHDSRNVSCVSCHSAHSYKSEKAQLKTVSVVQTCEQCHKQEAMKTQRSGHMPVREGKMECTTCHSAHGSTNVRMLKAGNTINESCTTCHAEKRGPYLWEHAAVTENCASCHDPHGSNNDRMLVAKTPMLCQRCHVSSGHPPTIYDNTAVTSGNARMIGRSCVNCHAQIHGSNSPAGNRFIR